VIGEITANHVNALVPQRTVIGPRTYQATDRLTGLKQEFNHSGAQLTSATDDKDHAIPYPLADA
jgi:hypothetical protein